MRATLRVLGVLTALASASCLEAVSSCAGFVGHTVEAKAREVDDLPVGLEVTHDPVEVRARWDAARREYAWDFTTTVRALEGPVTIEEFGGLSKVAGRWVSGRTFDAQDFAEWYGCPAAEVSPDVPCADPKNWERSKRLQDSASRWYFIGRRPDGTRVKGEAPLRLVGAVGPQDGLQNAPP
ncbi:MAG: hypothetical protein KC933_38630 [Myxococcales bacterium]|nr:hypothetical protein [Myxococcales bacterium]MCB9647331.1 hypothetical protein [Deltaproteobacteria bacterium]